MKLSDKDFSDCKLSSPSFSAELFYEKLSRKMCGKEFPGEDFERFFR
jgi:hypothetical protein